MKGQAVMKRAAHWHHRSLDNLIEWSRAGKETDMGRRRGQMPREDESRKKVNQSESNQA